MPLTVKLETEKQKKTAKHKGQRWPGFVWESDNSFVLKLLLEFEQLIPFSFLNLCRVKVHYEKNDPV